MMPLQTQVRKHSLLRCINLQAGNHAPNSAAASKSGASFGHALLLLNAQYSDQVICHHLCLAMCLQGNLKSMLNNCVLLPINSPWDASCLPTFNSLAAEHRSAQTQI